MANVIQPVYRLEPKVRCDPSLFLARPAIVRTGPVMLDEDRGPSKPDTMR